jgi:hypothetical protein
MSQKTIALNRDVTGDGLALPESQFSLDSEVLAPSMPNVAARKV